MVRDGGNLLTRAGLALPAVDQDDSVVRYAAGPAEVVEHLRAMGESNAVQQRQRYLGKDVPLAAGAAYSNMFGSEVDGSVQATYQVMYLAGWSPHEAQQQPAKRGSATVSFQELATGLQDSGKATGGSGAIAAFALTPPPSPPLLAAPLRPVPPRASAPPSPETIGALTSLRITFFGLDLWSLCTWQSDVEALVNEQRTRTNVSMAYLTAPGMCYSALKALNYTTLLNTSLPVEQLMPGLDYFVADITGVLRSYFTDESLSVGASDYCAGNRTDSTFYNSTTPVNGTWATLHVMVTVSSPSPQGLTVLPTTMQLRNLQRNW
ncbi:methyltransf_11 domain-containing protein, partial [Haematococcus lacustris]